MALYALQTGQRIEWQESLNDFIDCHCSGTAKRYRHYLAELERLIGKPLIEITEDMAIHFVHECLKAKGYKSAIDPTDIKIAPITVRQKCGLLSTATDHLIKTGHMTHNPWFPALRLLRAAQPGDKRPNDALTTEQVKRLFSVPSTVSKEGIRDRAILFLQFGAGLRISEALKLTLQDVLELECGNLAIRLRKQKNHKTSPHLLQDWVADQIRTLVLQRRAEGATIADPLIVVYRASGTPDNKHCSYWGVRKWWISWIRAAGLPENATTHWGRCTAITRLLGSEHDHRKVQEFSRHASVTMVERYDKRRMSIDEAVQKKLKYE